MIHYDKFRTRIFFFSFLYHSILSLWIIFYFSLDKYCKRYQLTDGPRLINADHDMIFVRLILILKTMIFNLNLIFISIRETRMFS